LKDPGNGSGRLTNSFQDRLNKTGLFAAGGSRLISVWQKADKHQKQL